MIGADTLLMRVEAPICAFRPFASREYQDTYPVPTPASVYGMLLSFLGLGINREEKDKHMGVRMALALSPCRQGAKTVDEALPWRSSVFRKLRRVSQYGYNKVKRQGSDAVSQFVVSQRRPDYQDVLTDIVLWVWLQAGNDKNKVPLPGALAAALAEPSSINERHGGLSLGESSFLVNRINAVTPDVLPAQVVALKVTERGFYSLPIWTDYKHDHSTFRRFELQFTTSASPSWITLAPDA